MTKYRILSLDGGGSWALLQVMALRAMYGEKATGYDVLRDFDLVIANSGGSITLGGLLKGLELGDVLENFYLNRDKRLKIFAEFDPWNIETFDISKKPLRKLWNSLTRRTIDVGAKYDTEAKLKGLNEILDPIGRTPLNEVIDGLPESGGIAWPHVVICSYDYDRQRAKFFRSDVGSLSASTSKESVERQSQQSSDEPLKDRDPSRATLAQAIHASSNAPVQYFLSPTSFDSDRYWDGAIAGYNNPLMAGITEAIANGVATNNIVALSIGTASISRPYYRKGMVVDDRLVNKREDFTLLSDIRRLAGAVLEDPPQSATYVAHVVLGNGVPQPHGAIPVNGSVVRLSPHLRPRQSEEDNVWDVPNGLGIYDWESDADAFEKLWNLDLDVIDDEGIQRLCALGNRWIEDKVDNQAIRENRHGVCQIGFDKFNEAVGHWRTLLAND